MLAEPYEAILWLMVGMYAVIHWLMLGMYEAIPWPMVVAHGVRSYPQQLHPKNVIPYFSLHGHATAVFVKFSRLSTTSGHHGEYFLLDFQHNRDA